MSPPFGDLGPMSTTKGQNPNFRSLVRQNLMNIVEHAQSGLKLAVSSVSAPGQSGMRLGGFCCCVGISTLVLGLGASGVALAQEPTAARTMLVTVYDRNDRPTVDVGPDDFLIEEGNDEREVLSVQVADYPVTLLLDNGVEQAASLDTLKTAAGRFIERIGQRPIAVATLADPPVWLAGFDDERAAVVSALNRIAPAPPATLRPLAALTQAAERIRSLESAFSVVIVLSMSAVDPTEQPDADRVTPIIESQAVVHVIALRPPQRPGEPGEPGRPGGPGGDAIKPDLYKVLTDQTRGQFVPIYSPVSFTIALERLADQLSTEMMIDYLVPPNTSGRDARVGIRVPGARVRGLGVSR